ncbi:hypothetical protein ACFSM5_17965 [Lacibacterium aquatile]|uniref:Uncharacterized protein n=1 Tax=Lacibacterium aquatile TaxID=1168082 RepID=A0ABW5DUN6_9PROT
MRHVVILVLTALLAACQPLPAPYAPTFEEKASPLLMLRDATGVWVEVPSGIPPDLAQALADSVAENLRTADIPAAVGTGNRGSALLRAAGQIYPIGPAENQLALMWQFVGPDGKQVQWEQRETVPRAAGLRPTPGQVARMGQTISGRVIPLLATSTAAVPLDSGVLIGDVTGAPGDGNTALKRALEYTLKQRGVLIADKAGPTTLTIRGKIEIGKPVGLLQAIRLNWGLFQPDGSEIGTITQENDIPANSLDRTWGETALFAAEGAVDGLKPLIEKAPLPKKQP